MSVILRAFQRRLAGIDTSAIKASQRQLASMNTSAILEPLQRQLAGIDTSAVLKAFQRQFASIDTAAILQAYQQQSASIDTTAILEAYQVSIAGFITSPVGETVVEQATRVVALAEEPIGEPPPVQELDQEQLAAVSEAIAELGDLGVVPVVSDGDGLDWLVAATIHDADETRTASGPTAVQTAVMTLVIVSALSVVISSAPALTAAFGLFSIPVTLWPFIKALVASPSKATPDDDAP